jgi:hypothetical protein
LDEDGETARRQGREINWFVRGDSRLVSTSGIGWTKRGGIVRRATRLQATRAMPASPLLTIAGADRGRRVSRREVRAGRSCLAWRVCLPVGAAADVVNGLVDEVGDARLEEGGHGVDHQAGWPLECPSEVMHV